MTSGPPEGLCERCEEARRCPAEPSPAQVGERLSDRDGLAAPRGYGPPPDPGEPCHPGVEWEPELLGERDGLVRPLLCRVRLRAEEMGLTRIGDSLHQAGRMLHPSRERHGLTAPRQPPVGVAEQDVTKGCKIQ